MDSTQDMRLAGAGITNGDQVAAAVQPVACRQGLDAGAWQGWQCLEVEGCQCLASRELCFVQMAPDAAHVPLGQFIFRQNGEETGGRPAFGVGAGGNLGPELVEAGQPQRGQHAGQRVDVDLAGGHALAPSRASKLSSEGWATATSLCSAVRFGLRRSVSVPGSGARPASRSSASRCASSASHAWSWAMNRRPTIRRQASRLGRSRCSTFQASAYSIRGNRLSR